jgi:hypothetical protein
VRASEWIKENVDGCSYLKPETTELISDFTLMWSVFEASEGNDTELVQQIHNLSCRLAQDMPLDAVDDLVDYWANRYIRCDKAKEHSRYLKFRDRRQRALVMETLANPDANLQQKLESCLLIVYRYRNNMFHGLKSILRMNGQKENFIHAISLLQRVLSHSGRHVYLSA